MLARDIWAANTFSVHRTGYRRLGVRHMSETQCFALGVVLVAIGAAAAFQIIHIDTVLKLVSIGALGVTCAVAAMVFFICAFRK